MTNAKDSSMPTLYRAPMFNHERSTLERVEKFISEHHFVDCNLYGRLYGQKASVNLKHCEFGHENVDFFTAVHQLATKGWAEDFSG